MINVTLWGILLFAKALKTSNEKELPILTTFVSCTYHDVQRYTYTWNRMSDSPIAERECVLFIINDRIGRLIFLTKLKSFDADVMTWTSFPHYLLLERGVPSNNNHSTWWRHQMETFSALLALCAGISPVTGEFPAQRPVTQSFDVFHLCLNKQLSKQSWGWWFETRADSRLAPSQWETALLCNDVSHWLGASLESALWDAIALIMTSL